MVDKSHIDSFIVASNDNSIFKSIYKTEYGTDISRTDTLTYQLVPNLQGNYLKLLDKVIEFDTTFVAYKEFVESSGDIGQPLKYGIQDYHNQIDFNNEIIRLFIAIHYISLKSYTIIKIKE